MLTLVGSKEVRVPRDFGTDYQGLFERLLFSKGERSRIVDKNINPDSFPGMSTGSFRAFLFQVNCNIAFPSILQELVYRRYRFATMIELLAFRHVFGNDRAIGPIAALGQKWEDAIGENCFGYLPRKNESRRDLALCGTNIILDRMCQLLAVRI